MMILLRGVGPRRFQQRPTGTLAKQRLVWISTSSIFDRLRSTNFITSLGLPRRAHGLHALTL